MLQKGLFLIAILAIPVAIFVFLKIFGNNQFEVPMYFQVEAISHTDCEDVEIPYSVDDNLRVLGDPEKSSETKFLRVFAFVSSVEDTQQQNEKLYNLLRISDALGDKLQSFVFSNTDKDSVNKLDELIVNESDDEGIKVLYITQNTDFNCIFLLNKGLQLVEEETQEKSNLMVLVDKAGIIRGYYNAMSREDTDRLVVEAKILVKMN